MVRTQCSECHKEFEAQEPEGPITVGGFYGSYEIRWSEGQARRIAAYCSKDLLRAMLPYGHPDAFNQ